MNCESIDFRLISEVDYYHCVSNILEAEEKIINDEKSSRCDLELSTYTPTQKIK